MPFLRHTRVLLLLTALAIGAAVWVASSVQRHAADTGHTRQANAEQLLTGMLDMETGVRGFLVTRRDEFLAPFVSGQAIYRRALVALGPAKDVESADRAAQQWQDLALSVVDQVRLHGGKASTLAGSRLRKGIFDRFRVEQHNLSMRLDRDRRDSSNESGLVAAGISLLLALLLGLVGDVLIGRRDRAERARRRADAAYRETQSEFAETLQLAESEAEAHELLRRHLERSVSDSQVIVLNRNNSHDRLEPVTRVADPGIAERLQGAQPRSCLAVRLGRESSRDAGDDPLMTCDICGATPSSTTCRPVVVGSEVIGSVLVTHHQPLTESDRAHLQDSISQAAPALANLRNLALAEMRAATDVLTGLPNRRAIEDTLKRMIAQSSRGVQPLSALMVDLDHFKTINDLYGHELGDGALAATGALLTDSLRESDFAGRQGGEEFIVLAPATDSAGAAVLAENLRAAIAVMKVPGLDHTLTASIGVATFPDVASSATGLVRMADRALYAAKELGRNRVEASSAIRAPDLPASERDT